MPATFSQLLHRELFKHALTWRKGLTKQERYFLECYCAGRHPFGGDGLSTNWHRFALKICLEAIKFEFVALPGDEGVRTLHVKHPALASVIHRRGDEVVARREHLSSLKDETIVEQVGLDVKEGDSVIARTIAGSQSVFWV